MTPTIHLDECDPASHGWQRTVYRDAVAAGGRLCGRTDYMDGELLPDETVWLQHDQTDH